MARLPRYNLTYQYHDEDQGTKSHREWQTYIFKKYGALNPETL